LEIFNSRAGKTVPQGSGYLAFVPAVLPPNPPIVFDNEMIRLLSDADIALGRLSGIADVLPNPDLFVAMYVRKEAVLSSQIEGIQCTLDEVLEAEIDDGAVRTKEVGEVVNYVDAMNYGVARLETLPLSLRLICEIHARLMDGVRGEHKAPGEFRKTQNWIGSQGATLANAAFVPPPVPDMQGALSNFEKFLHDRHSMPLAIQCAVAHLQFETIHPFLDGNGRIGRLLVPLMLHQRGALTKPLLYISHYLKSNRVEYYDRLMDVRKNGNWEGWVKFFLTGVAAVGHEAAETAKRIVQFRNEAQKVAADLGRHELSLVEHLFKHPIIDARAAEKLLQVSFVSANSAVLSLEKAGLIKETTGKKRGRIFRFEPYLKLFDDPIPVNTPIYDQQEQTGYVHGIEEEESPPSPEADSPR
jgi:Fic family protein